MIQLPLDFTPTITNTFGADGERFLANLPALIDDASARWGLTNVQPVENLSYNFVAYANLTSPPAPLLKGEGSVILKLGIPRGELTSEVGALRLFDGEGACKLIDADEERGFLLLERLQPGEMLSTLEDDEEATRIAAEVMKRIWRFDYGAANTPLRSARNKFIQLSDWFDRLKRLREIFNGGTGPLDAKLVERVERSTKYFFAENHMPVLMHGDFHHFNILSSERGWLVIDPKGVIGPACYEVGPLMMNPWGRLPRGGRLKSRIERRVDILHEHLGFERERILEWSLWLMRSYPRGGGSMIVQAGSIRCGLRKSSPPFKKRTTSHWKVVQGGWFDYLPSKANTAYARARMPAIIAAAGNVTKAPTPTQRKYNHIHQPEIVEGNFILYSPEIGI